MATPETEFDFNEWEWIATHFEPLEKEAIAKAALLICQCNPQQISKHNLDPRIVIPLCAIALFEEIDIVQLKQFSKEVEQVSLAQETSPHKQQFVNTIVSRINPSDRWLYLFKTLDKNKQFNLLNRLINYRRPRRSDWRNLFLEVKYEFKKSWHYRLVLIISLLISIMAIIGGILEIYPQPERWINGLIVIAIYIIIVFLLSLLAGIKEQSRWRDIQEQLELSIFTRFGILGIFTFLEEFRRLIRGYPPTNDPKVYPNSTGTFSNIVSGTSFVIMGGIMSGIFIKSAIISKFWAWDWTGARAILDIAIVLFWAYLLVSCVCMIMMGFINFSFSFSSLPFWLSLTIDCVVAVAIAVVLAAVLFRASAETVFVVNILALIISLMSLGFSGWGRFGTQSQQNFSRFFAIFAFPLFCWLPIILVFSYLFLLRFFSWQFTSLIWLVILSFCSILWIYGQQQDRKASNPLKGIL